MKYLITLFVVVLLVSCIKRDHCNNSLSIVGTYENVYDKDAENTLYIKEDGTFEQKFKKKGKKTRHNVGTWKFFNESCNVRFKNLKILHNLQQDYIYKFENMPGKYRNNNIIFVEGMTYEFDFFRK